MTPSSTRLHIVYALFTLYKWRDISNWMVFTMSRTLVDESNIRPVYNIVLSSEIYFSNSRLVLGNVWTSWAFFLLLYLILTSKKFGSNFSYCGKCKCVDDDEPFCSIAFDRHICWAGVLIIPLLRLMKSKQTMWKCDWWCFILLLVFLFRF